MAARSAAAESAIGGSTPEAAASPDAPAAASAAHQGHRDYGLALAWLDRGVGTIIWALQRRGRMHDTLLAFSSDHGSVDKGHCFSRSTSVPLLVQWPAAVPSGGRIARPVSLLALGRRAALRALPD